MSKLRAIGQWIWLKKERMFLFVMLVILMWRVYMVMNPPTTQEETIRPPSPSVDMSQLKPEDRPGEPAPPGEPPASYDWSSLWVRNPFSVYSDTTKTTRGEDDKADEIQLLDIQKKGNAPPTVKLRYGNTQKWHKEGDAFVSYKLVSIDIDSKTCEVYSEKRGRSVTLKLKK